MSDLSAVAVILTSTFLVGLGFSITATPSQRLYESVICCQHLNSDCFVGVFVDETLCRDDPDVQIDLAAITAGLSSFGAFGIVIATIWITVWNRQRIQRRVFYAQFGAVLGEAIKAAIAFSNGRLPLSFMYWVSPLEGGGGITYTVLICSLVTDITSQNLRSLVIFFRSTVEAHLTSYLGDYMVGHHLNGWAPFSCVLASLALQSAGVLSLLLLPSTNQIQHEPKSARQCLATLFRSPWPIILLCLTAIIYNPIRYTNSTLARQYLSMKFELDMGETSAVFARARGWLLIILLVIVIIFAALLLTKLAAGTWIQFTNRDLVFAMIFLMLATIGNLILADSQSTSGFTAGLVLTNLGMSFSCVVEGLLAIRGGLEHKTDLLLANQLIEAVGRFILVPVVSRLFAVGMNPNGRNGELAFYGVSGMCVVSLGVLGVAAYLWSRNGSGGEGQEANNSRRESEDNLDGGLGGPANERTPLRNATSGEETETTERPEN